jgi:hypothetical protein
MDDLVLEVVICRTEGCSNCDVPLTLYCADLVFCGPCGAVITDIQVVQ